MKYFNTWEKIDDLHKNFIGYGKWEEGKRLEGFPTDAEVLFASYEQGRYDGDSLVLFRRGGKVYCNSGLPCSCRGLEGQWGPDEVITPEQIPKPVDHGDEAIAACEKVMQALF